MTAARRSVLLLLATACTAAPAPLAVEHAEIRVAPVGAVTAAGYLVIRGGEVADTLDGVGSAAGVVTLHESMDHGDGVMMMMPLEWVAVPAGDSVAFTAGGRHLMLDSLSAPLAVGDTVLLTLRFRSGRVLEVRAPVRLVGGDE